MYGIIPKPLWEKKSPADALNRIDLALRVLLIQTDQKNILIDTGVGDYHDEAFNERFFIQPKKNPLSLCLAEIGLTPEDITDLVISHLHFDHVGGMTTLVNGENTAVFKNATLHLHKDHYEYALSPTARDAGSFQKNHFLPTLQAYEKKGKIHWFTGEQGLLIPEAELEFRCSHGHTPFLVHPFDEKFIYLADLIPMSHHIPIPWVMGYDIHPGQTVKDKENFLNFIYKREGCSIIYEHDPKFIGSLIERNEKGAFIPVHPILEKSPVTALFQKS